MLAWIWLQQAVVAQGETGDFYDGKRLAAQYFFHYELPKTATQFDLLDSGDRTTTDLDEEWFLWDGCTGRRCSWPKCRMG